MNKKGLPEASLFVENSIFVTYNGLITKLYEH